MGSTDVAVISAVTSDAFATKAKGRTENGPRDVLEKENERDRRDWMLQPPELQMHKLNQNRGIETEERPSDSEN